MLREASAEINMETPGALIHCRGVLSIGGEMFWMLTTVRTSSVR